MIRRQGRRRQKCRDLAAGNRVSADLLAKLLDGFAASPGGRLGVAVSGGSDSVALLHLLAGHAPLRDAGLYCVTVDHGLRPESAAEARFVSELCCSLDIPHQTLCWQGWDGRGNTQDAARRARYSLMADWAHTHGIGAVALGHTQDDQAETVLMRLARGAGVDGLSAMAGHRAAHGISWLRPMLGIGREELRGYLRHQGISWKDDPGNENTDYDRIRTRKALRDLEPLGIDAGRLAMVAAHMADARDVLQQQTHAVATELLEVRCGAVCMPWQSLCDLPGETRRRLVTGTLRWIGGGDYAPRHSSVSALMGTLETSVAGTAAGCQALRRGSDLWLFREYAAVRDLTALPDGVWDQRWTIAGPPAPENAVVSAVGAQDLATCAGWRDAAVPHAAMIVTPALRLDGQLIAAPEAQSGCQLQSGPHSTKDALLSALFSH